MLPVIAPLGIVMMMLVALQELTDAGISRWLGPVTRAMMAHLVARWVSDMKVADYFTQAELATALPAQARKTTKLAPASPPGECAAIRGPQFAGREAAIVYTAARARGR